MKDKVIIHGVEYVPKVIEPEPAKVGRWRPEDDEIYWWVSSHDEIIYSLWHDEYMNHERRYKFGNVYQTEALATKARDRQLLLVELQDFADSSNEGKKIYDHYYFLLKDINGWDWVSFDNYVPGTVIFRTRDGALTAIDHFGDRLNLLL